MAIHHSWDYCHKLWEILFSLSLLRPEKLKKWEENIDMANCPLFKNASNMNMALWSVK